MNKKYIYYQLVLGTLSAVFLGLAYSWSLFIQPIESSMGWNRSQTSLIFSLMMVFFFGGIFISGFLIARVPLRKILLASSISFLISFNICANAQNLLPIYIAYGVVNGLTTGISYFCIMNVVSRWFKDRMGVASGIMMTGFALGSFVLGSPVLSIISELGWRSTFNCYSFLFFLLMIVMAFALKLPPKVDSFPEKVDLNNTNSYTTAEMIRTDCFKWYALMAIFVFTIGVTTIGNIAVLISYTGASAAMAVIGTGAVSIGNGGSRVLFGYLYYKIGVKKTLLLVNLITLTASVLLIISLYMRNIWLLLPALLFAGASYGSISPCGSAVSMEYFGPAYYSQNFGINSTMGGVSSLVGTMVVGVLQAKFNSYSLSFSILLIYSIVAFIFYKFIPSSDQMKLQCQKHPS